MNKKLILIVCLFLACIFVSSFEKVLAFPASSSEIYDGIDMSEWQGSIDFAEVKESGIDIVYIKSSEGTRYIDPYFRTNYNSAKENGLNIGFYHFMTATTENEAIAEARFFASVVNGLDTDCRLAMDFEIFDGLDVREINNISLAFLTEVERLTEKEVVVYSDAYNARVNFSSRLSSQYPIWVAEYGVNEPSNGNWSSWIGFQYTNQGRVSGISGFVDRDYFTSDIFLSDNSTITVPNSSNPSVNTNYVIVKYGDTLSEIALRYNTSYQYLAKINNISNPNLIFVDERIYVPTLENSNLGDTSHVLYVVKRGNTLNQISRLYDVSIDSIVNLNDIRNPNLIFAGEVLRIPTIN
jgi:GH25 family lysozyme M1 (1,4-beta-N-acetylmuramidase)